MAVYQKVCTRCSGTGVVELTGGRQGACFGCANTQGATGHRIVRTGADKAAHDNYRRIVNELAPVIRKAGGSKAKEGLWKLLDREPARLVKLEESVKAGRMADVVTALVTYHES